MSDIITQLYNLTYMDDPQHLCIEAAREIRKLQELGDELARQYRIYGGLEVAHDPCLRAWEEARRA